MLSSSRARRSSEVLARLQEVKCPPSSEGSRGVVCVSSEGIRGVGGVFPFL